MSKEILFWTLILTVLSIFFNNYYWKQLTYLQQSNSMMYSVNNKMMPYEILEKENYTSNCISWPITEWSINNKLQTIQFYHTWSLSFSCNSDFYKWKNWLDNLIEMDQKVTSVCIIENTKNWNEQYYCSNN